MSEVIIGPNNEYLNRRLHNDRSRYFPYDWDDEDIREQYDGRGWDFSAGSPEYWKFSDHLLKKGGRLLDIGIGTGASSIYFALNGMEVVGLDNNPQHTEGVNKMSQELSMALPDFSMQARHADILQEELPSEHFDTVIISYLNHLSSQADFYKILDKATQALRPGGHIWVRGAGKHSEMYKELLRESQSPYCSDVWAEEDKNVIYHPCGCSGEIQIDPTVFFDPLDWLSYFSRAGYKIIDSQTIETEGRMNIMYGEDFRPDIEHTNGGMITILAQKSLNV